MLEAIVARLIPSDENGPGATEARAAHYIDRALVGPLRSSRAAYAAGLEALDTYAQTAKGAAFVKLSAADQDAALTDMEKNVATGFNPNASTFFNLVRTHTIQGTFCDSYYGGDANFVGWDLIGYPGLRLAAQPLGLQGGERNRASLRPGADPERLEVSNLGVLGASVMGTSGAHNPTLTALAWRTAEHLTRNWQSIADG